MLSHVLFCSVYVVLCSLCGCGCWFVCACGVLCCCCWFVCGVNCCVGARFVLCVIVVLWFGLGVWFVVCCVVVCLFVLVWFGLGVLFVMCVLCLVLFVV